MQCSTLRRLYSTKEEFASASTRGVHAAFGKHFAKTGQLDAKYHQWVLSAFKKRIAGDYGMDAVITADQVKQMIEQAREFLEAARRYLEVAS